MTRSDALQVPAFGLGPERKKVFLHGWTGCTGLSSSTPLAPIAGILRLVSRDVSFLCNSLSSVYPVHPVYPMFNRWITDQPDRVLVADRPRSKPKEIHSYSCLFVFIRGSSLSTPPLFHSRMIRSVVWDGGVASQIHSRSSHVCLPGLLLHGLPHRSDRFSTLTGWIWRRTRRFHLGLMILTLFSWFRPGVVLTASATVPAPTGTGRSRKPWAKPGFRTHSSSTTWIG